MITLNICCGTDLLMSDVSMHCIPQKGEYLNLDDGYYEVQNASPYIKPEVKNAQTKKVINTCSHRITLFVTRRQMVFI